MAWDRNSKVDYLGSLLNSGLVKEGLVARSAAIKYAKENGWADPVWFVNSNEYRADRGVLQIPADFRDADYKASKAKSFSAPAKTQPALAALSLAVNNEPVAPVVQEVVVSKVYQQAKLAKTDFGYVPKKNDLYIPFGFFTKLRTIVKSGAFFPVMITGLSGNGKTEMVEQVCAALGRRLVRYNVHEKSDDVSMVGADTLVDGNVVFREGPVVSAMRTGSILLLDEIDRGGDALICLQGIMEGKPFIISSTGETVYPKPGFNIIATANTKGQGSDTGAFSAAKILDDAFLERFPITVEQEYPNENTERKIIGRKAEALGIENQDKTLDVLARWSRIIRETYAEGGVSNVVSTRRLCNVVETFAIFNDVELAVELCVSRFNDDTKKAFMDLFRSIKPAQAPASIGEEVKVSF